MPVQIDYSILKVLTYFDMFRYPVLKEEILFFLDRPVTDAELDTALTHLAKTQCLFYIDGFYSLQNDPTLAEKRKKNNAQAKSLLKTAHKIARLLYHFPFVRGIGISGSLSKNCADENADIDFFIITRSNRLWIARTLMGLFRKMAFIIGKQHWFCLNYYIDENALLIQEQNIFTSTELITLIPAIGNETLKKFFSANDWAVKYYPNYRVKLQNNRGANKNSFLKSGMEYLFNNRLGDKLDIFLMKKITSRWKRNKLDQKLNKRGFRMDIKTSRHFIKPNPALFQQKIISSYTGKLAEQETKWNTMRNKQETATTCVTLNEGYL